jgi:hypothetical protein
MDTAVSSRGRGWGGRIALVGVLGMVVSVLLPVMAARAATTAYAFDPKPISAKPLPAGTTVGVLLTVTSDGNPAPGATVYLSFTPASNSTASAKAGPNQQLLTPVPLPFTADANGTVTISYTTSPTPVTSGTDTITAQDASSNPAVTATDTYSYGALDTYSITPSPVAAPGSLKTDDMVCVTITQKNAQGQPNANQPVQLSESAPSWGNYYVINSSGFKCDPSNPGNVPMFTAANATRVPPSPAFNGATTDASGNVYVVFRIDGDPTAQGGTAILNAQSPNGSIAGSDSYSAKPLSITLTPTPIKAPGTLGPGQTVNIKLQANNNDGSPAAGATIYLNFAPASGGNASASANGQSIPNNSNLNDSYTADANGRILINYTASATGGTGQDVLKAADANFNANPTTVVQDTYSYSTSAFVFTPSPIAGSGTLTANSTVDITVSVVDPATGAKQGGKQVFMSFSPAFNSGATASAGGTALSGTPTAVTSGADGTIAVTYKTGATPPSSGTDTITVQDKQLAPSASATDTYNYTSPVYTFSPSPIAATGTLAPGAKQNVTLALTDTSGAPRPNDYAYLSFTPTANGGSAAANSTPLTSTPQPFQADGQGKISITYSVPLTLPGGGTDVIKATNGGLAVATDSYTFATAAHGYWLAGSDGKIYAHGGAGAFGQLSSAPNKPVVGIAATADRQGYWTVASDGGIFSFGSAKFFGSMGGKPLNKPIVGIAPTTDGNGYWMVASDGGIFSFGSAKFFGSMGGKPLNQPIVGMAATPDGNGYWMVASDGGMFSFGSARFYGSMGGKPLNRPVVGMSPVPDGGGYILVASDGGIFAFGSAKFFGSTGSMKLNQPIVGMALTDTGNGYWFVASDGGIFSFGDAPFDGSEGGTKLSGPIVGMAAV